MYGDARWPQVQGAELLILSRDAHTLRKFTDYYRNAIVLIDERRYFRGIEFWIWGCKQTYPLIKHSIAFIAYADF